MRRENLVRPAEIVASIAKGPRGPTVIAAFDFEGALVGGLTGSMVMQERIRRKEVKLPELAATAGVTFEAMAHLVEANEVVARSVSRWAGKTDREMEEFGNYLYEHQIQDSVFPEMRDILAAHREAGHTIVVATAVSRYQVEPTVKALGIANLLCTEVEVADGKLTGNLVGDSLIGGAKVAALERFIADRGGTLAATHFYADGDEEVALMEAVGHPHPVNPAKKLAEAARAGGWPVLRLQSRRRAKAGDLVRGVAGLATIVPILQVGFSLGLLRRDKRRAANLIMPTWLQAQLKLAGVKLRVAGRENLTAQRPAVFVFNHRNNFDASFVAALVRSDYVTVAKKEMAKNPVGKLIAGITPTIFIDRDAGDPAKTAETLAQIVEAIGQGYSIILAPEGTRVRGNPNSVGRFKLGAFQVAMTAGVPIVPVVIRNALDVASHGGPMRPGTVDIAVLPPTWVEGSDRRALSAKVKDVRQMFVDTLADWPAAG